LSTEREMVNDLARYLATLQSQLQYYIQVYRVKKDIHLRGSPWPLMSQAPKGSRFSGASALTYFLPAGTIVTMRVNKLDYSSAVVDVDYDSPEGEPRVYRSSWKSVKCKLNQFFEEVKT